VHAGFTTLEPYWGELSVRVERLARRRQQYADIFDLATLAAVVTDARGTIQEANRAMGALVGRRPALLAGKPLVALVCRDSQRAFLTNLLRPAGLCWSITP
jgi:PAS domain-containing protein